LIGSKDLQLISCITLDNTTYMLYNLPMKKDKILEHQNTILRVLADKINDFYLVGGTALSLFYFQHRLSFDLDFFSPQLSYKRVKEIISYLATNLKTQIKLTAQILEKDKTKMFVYHIYFTNANPFKIDFVEDIFNLIKVPIVIEGIKVLSLEDIYLRKIYALVGTIPSIDDIGKKKFIGGRATAKDFYDLFFLSNTFMSLSKFVVTYRDSALKEALINWFRTYDRMQMIDGVLSLQTNKNVDCKVIEAHFHKEIEQIIKSELEEL